MLVIDWSLLVDILVKTASFIFSFPEDDIILATASESFDVTFVKAVFTTLLTMSSWSLYSSLMVSESMLLKLSNKSSAKFCSWFEFDVVNVFESIFIFCTSRTAWKANAAVSLSPDDINSAIVAIVFLLECWAISLKILLCIFFKLTCVSVLISSDPACISTVLGSTGFETFPTDVICLKTSKLLSDKVVITSVTISGLVCIMFSIKNTAVFPPEFFNILAVLTSNVSLL